jgi:D-glycero-D-manno-heptose 1,7-bisphosphate phosphatase
MRRKAAFLDRDGVINEDRSYVHRPEDFVLLPGVLEALRMLQDDDYALVIVSNQSGIARGFYTALDYQRVVLYMQSLFAAEGIALAGVYHCPHHPQAFVERYRRVCECRKPGPGLIHLAADELGLSLRASILVGDQATDIEAGRAAGVGRCYLLAPTGVACAAGADGVFPSLLECARSVCEETPA